MSTTLITHPSFQTIEKALYHDTADDDGNSISLYIIGTVYYRLAVCEKALAEYLETKRLAFPRFYFVSAADLLAILSQGNEPTEVSFKQQISYHGHTCIYAYTIYTIYEFLSLK